MTIDKKEVITIPRWWVILFAPMLVAGIVAYGTMNAWKGSYEETARRNNEEIQKLYEQKCDRNEMNLLLNTLDRIENKLDTHISEK